MPSEEFVFVGFLHEHQGRTTISSIQSSKSFKHCVCTYKQLRWMTNITILHMFAFRACSKIISTHAKKNPSRITYERKCVPKVVSIQSLPSIFCHKVKCCQYFVPSEILYANKYANKNIKYKTPTNGKRTHFTVCMSNGNFHAPPTTKPFPLIIWKGKVWIVSCLSRIQHLCTFQLLLLNIRIAYLTGKKQ